MPLAETLTATLPIGLADRLARPLGRTVAATVGRRVDGDVRRLLAPRPLPPEWFARSADDPGLVPADGVAWRVHRNRAGLVGGLRALLIQTLHPLAMAGVAQHSDYRHDPWGRLHRTGAFIGVTTYGTTEAAERMIATIRRVHERVVGVSPGGLPYRANDPHLLKWVHSTEVDSFLRAYERYGGEGRLSLEDADRYLAEMAVVGEKLGVIDPPRTREELRAWFREVRPELAVTREARETVRFLLTPPLPLALRPPYGVLAAAAVGQLPAFARRELLLPSPPLVDPVLVQPATKLLLHALDAMVEPPPHVDASNPPAADSAHQRP